MSTLLRDGNHPGTLTTLPTPSGEDALRREELYPTTFRRPLPDGSVQHRYGTEAVSARYVESMPTLYV
ncbi:hypothetical protein QE152_g39229 [Popillia japonica]|uniref:Uncharacterized protein n=1 Tax=Popillia japonica TaxID=7064 RepID=A0AAW1HUC1_POPJA